MHGGAIRPPHIDIGIDIDILGIDILGIDIDILGIDILGIDILGIDIDILGIDILGIDIDILGIGVGIDIGSLVAPHARTHVSICFCRFAFNICVRISFLSQLLGAVRLLFCGRRHAIGGENGTSAR